MLLDAILGWVPRRVRFALSRKRFRRGRRRGRLPQVIPMLISRKVKTPGRTWVTDKDVSSLLGCEGLKNEEYLT